MEQTVLKIEDRNEFCIVRVQAKKLYQNLVIPFREEMMALTSEGRKKLVVDLSDVDVMNSAALGVLILTWDSLSKENGKLVLFGLCPLMTELFQRMRLDLIFPVTQNEDEAIQLVGL